MFVFRSCSFSMRNDVPTLKRPQKCTARREQNPMNTRQFRIGRLANLGQVIKALGKTIRAMADGSIDSQVGARICNGLGIMRACLETQKLEQLEARMDEIADRVARDRTTHEAQRFINQQPGSLMDYSARAAQASR
jgi:hypothetical protein